MLHLAGNELTGRYASAMPAFCLMDPSLQRSCTQMSNALIILALRMSQYRQLQE